MQSAIQSSSYALHEQIPALAQELRSCSIELASCKCAFRCVQREVMARLPHTLEGCVSCPIKRSPCGLPLGGGPRVGLWPTRG